MKGCMINQLKKNERINDKLTEERWKDDWKIKWRKIKGWMKD